MLGSFAQATYSRKAGLRSSRDVVENGRQIQWWLFVGMSVSLRSDKISVVRKNVRLVRNVMPIRVYAMQYYVKDTIRDYYLLATLLLHTTGSEDTTRDGIQSNEQ
jgi:hypothetical protein